MNPEVIDQIGNRLDHPELVSQKYQHLIADDQQRVKRILQFEVTGRILDVGCSDWAITTRIRDRWSVDAFGADVRKPVQPFGPFILWDCRKPWPTTPIEPLFDTIYACEMFEHLTDGDAAIALINILAVLKPGGDLIVTVPNRHPHDTYEIGCRSRWAWPDHRSGWTRDKLRSFLNPYFIRPGWFETVPLYHGETEEDSIWIIARARYKQ